jgi:hypothetical protein
MCFSPDNAAWGDWEPFAALRSYNLEGPDGVKWVYVKYRDEAQNETEGVGDSIFLDANPPTDGTLTAAPGNQQVSLNWTAAADGTGSGLDKYELYCSTTGFPTPETGDKLYEGPELSYLHQNLAAGTKYYYRVYAVDLTGNRSAGATAAANLSSAANPHIPLLLLEDKPASPPL